MALVNHAYHPLVRNIFDGDDIAMAYGIRIKKLDTIVSALKASDDSRNLVDKTNFAQENTQVAVS